MTGLGQRCAYPDCDREFHTGALVKYEGGVGWVHYPECPHIRTVYRLRESDQQAERSDLVATGS